MEPFSALTAIAAPLDELNLDTNQLSPTRFNKVPYNAADYSRILLHDRRFRGDGTEIAEFVLNREPYRRARILVGDRNFGCGSSRESAAMSLKAFGVRVVIAPSFGDIFFNNCLKNSVVPVMLDAETCAAMRAQLHARIGAEITVDLQRQVATDAAGREHPFSIHPLRRRCLLEGLDDIALTAGYLDVMRPFETRYRQEFSWLDPDASAVIADGQ